MKELNLHNIKHNEVPRLVDRFIAEHLLTQDEVVIITGHSDHMKKIVNMTLCDYGLSGEEGIYNKGQLIVKL